jgi:four helix bundle protein
MNNSIVKQRAFAFAKDSIDLYKILISKNEFVLSKQFIKSATSIGANISEALAGQSRKDFTAKMSISSKESRESLYWIELLEYSELIDFDYTQLKKRNIELIKILTSIVKTCQQNF